VKHELEARVVRYLVAGGVALVSIGTALPDGAPGSSRSITTAIGIALIGSGVYLGAPKPS